MQSKATELTALDLFPHLTSIRVPDKCPYYMGSRMGRPEKAKERKMKPPVQVLFPIGQDSKLARSVQNAVSVGSIEVEICQKRCPKCGAGTFLNRCNRCGTHTDFLKVCGRCNKPFPETQTDCPDCGSPLGYAGTRKVPIRKYYNAIASKFKGKIPTVKGVKGMMSAFKVPEPLEKGILRAKNGVWVYKDGTIRADATDIPLTHFTCKEIDTPVDKIVAMGYDIDVDGQPITNENQIIELKCQDVLLTHHLGDYFVNVAHFVDEELEMLYDMPRFYNVKTRYDLVGHYMAGLAPHTSAAIVGRLIGFTYAESGYAHPMWHAAKRRNCDGDEDGIMLLLECLLNFSKYNLPSKIGGKMDAPLVVSVLLDPREVDGEAHHVDYMAKYPLQFYKDSLKYAHPGDLKYMKLYIHELGKEGQFEGAKFTHPTKNINFGPKKSAYTIFETMDEKLNSQMWLAKSIVAVDEKHVAEKVLSSHFTPDVLGNLRSFSTQGFRCTKCGAKFRRIPLSGSCSKCGADNLLMTVHAGGISKYLHRSISMIKDFELGDYTKQRWELIERYVTSLTFNPRVKQKTLSSFFK